MTEAAPVRRVTAVLLAAGLSTRMGEFKQLMPYGSSTIVGTCAATLLGTSADEIVVVTGHRADEVERSLGGCALRFVRNPSYEDGMASSVIAGVRAASPGNSVMICLCDQPHVPADVHETVLAAYRASGAAVVVPTIAGDSGHPVIFDSSLRDEILAIDPAVGLRGVTYANRDSTLRVPVDAVGVLDDIDTQEDYVRLQ